MRASDQQRGHESGQDISSPHAIFIRYLGMRCPAAFELRLSHFAFRGSGLGAFLERLKRAGIQHAVGKLPGAAITQVNLRDIDGNALHVDFTDEHV